MTGRALELKLALWLLGVSGEHDFFQVVSDEWVSFRKSVKWMVHVVFTGYFAGVSVSTNRSGTFSFLGSSVCRIYASSRQLACR